MTDLVPKIIVLHSQGNTSILLGFHKKLLRMWDTHCVVKDLRIVGSFILQILYIRGHYRQER